VDSSATPLVVGPIIGIEGSNPLVGFKANGQPFFLTLESGSLMGGPVYFSDTTCSGAGFVPISQTMFRSAGVDGGGRIWVESPNAQPDNNFLPGSYVWGGSCNLYSASFGRIHAMPAFVAVDLAQQFIQPFQVQ
jgi:hypothetical protein